MNIVALNKIAQASQVLKFRHAATKTFAPVSRLALNHGPEILTGVGIAGGVGTVILASQATLKLEATLDKINEELVLVETNRVLVNEHNVPVFSESDIVKQIAKVKAKGALEIVKLYAPSATLGAASVGAVLGAHGIMKRRNVALAAAYKAIETSFASYRKRVIEEFGEEKDRDFRLGLRDEKVKDEETGKTKTVTHIDPNGISQYARFFDEGNSSFQKNPDFNLAFLRTQQNYFNDKLTARHFVFLNEVYDALGLEQTKAGSVVGWHLDAKGDGYVDFGIYNFASQKAREFVNGLERSILLDFNVDGVITSYLPD